MNIFFLDRTPTTCQYHNDKHVVKMVIEYSSYSPLHIVYLTDNNTGTRPRMADVSNDTRCSISIWTQNCISFPRETPFEPIWTRQSVHNYNWLFDLWFALSKEYEYRYNREHLTFTKLNKILMKPPKGML